MKIKTPTGHILTINGEKGKQLEIVSLADYGKMKNIKADFLGVTDEINGVPHGGLMPLTEKWVVTISTQYGCSMGCIFCDVPKVGPGVNATLDDLHNQVVAGLSTNPEVTSTKRLNIHFARMGEPTFNYAVIDYTANMRKLLRSRIGRSLIHPVVSTMLPRNNPQLNEFLSSWVSDIKNDLFRGDAGLQFSINSTDDTQREEMFSGNSLSLEEISEIGTMLEMPRGRKFALNFAIADNFIIEHAKLRRLFDPKKFMVKITPLHFTAACTENGLTCKDAYELFQPYRDLERKLKGQGFDVLVFVPSKEEDESRITCGNAILADEV